MATQEPYTLGEYERAERDYWEQRAKAAEAKLKEWALLSVEMLDTRPSPARLIEAIRNSPLIAHADYHPGMTEAISIIERCVSEQT